MQRTFLALALAAAAPAAQAQNAIGENPVLEDGAVTCGAYLAMDSLARQNALTAVEPVGGELPGADLALVRQWEGEVARACEGHPDRLVEDAARQALGGN